MFYSYTDILQHLEIDGLVWLFAFREHWFSSFVVLYVLVGEGKVNFDTESRPRMVAVLIQVGLRDNRTLKKYCHAMLSCIYA